MCVFLAGIQSVGIGACMHVCVWYAELTCISMGLLKQTFRCVKVLCVCVHACMCVCVRVLACLCVCGIQSRLVYRMWPLERTLWVRSSALVCFDRWRGHSRCRAPLTTGVDITPGSYHLHTVCFWQGHSHCRAPLTTGVEFYHRVLPYKITTN